MKEIKLSPNIAPHDVEYRVKQANKFLEKGNQVKVSLLFKGREKIHEEIGMKTIQDFVYLCTAGKLVNNIKRIQSDRRLVLTATLNPKSNKGK